MPNRISEWSFEAKCNACDRAATTIRLVYETPEDPDGPVRYMHDSPGGQVSEPGWTISLERAETIKAAFAPPHTLERIRQAQFWDDSGFCSECSQFYCWTHWNVSTIGGGWCPQGHFKLIDPHCSYESYNSD